LFRNSLSYCWSSFNFASDNHGLFTGCSSSLCMCYRRRDYVGVCFRTLDPLRSHGKFDGKPMIMWDYCNFWLCSVTGNRSYCLRILYLPFPFSSHCSFHDNVFIVEDYTLGISRLHRWSDCWWRGHGQHPAFARRLHCQCRWIRQWASGPALIKYKLLWLPITCHRT
jgi:hypothetical protein